MTKVDRGYFILVLDFGKKFGYFLLTRTAS
jgi:hypothetical protein